MSTTRIPSNLMISRMATDLVRQQNSLAEVQEQIASGKQVNRPSDAPAVSAHIISMMETESQLDQYTRNASSAESQLALQETALESTANALMRIRDLALSSNNGVADDQTRQAINVEVNLRLEELFGLANSSDSFGNFLFGGTNTRNRPFAPGVPVEYTGTDDTQRVFIGPYRTLQSTDSGSDVFMRVRNGNGTFNVQADIANTGTGIIDYGSVTDSSLYDAAPYELRFTSNTSFDIFNLDTGAAIQTAVPYTENGSIDFQGIKTSISGIPEAGDSFTITASENQDIFSTVSNFIDATNRSPANASERARMQQDVAALVVNIDRSLDHINGKRASVGARLNIIDSSRDENAGMMLEIQRTRSQVEDIDIAEAVSNLQIRANALEVLQKSFTRIEGLSLFNYLA